MSAHPPTGTANSAVTEQQVLAYLQGHPGLLTAHPELLRMLTPPKRDLGENIEDFQRFQVIALQQGAASLQEKYAELVDFCRANLSCQAQVHAGALRLMQARSLERLLETIRLDLTSIFDLDAVRLCIESGAAGAARSLASPAQMTAGIGSGFALIPLGLCEEAHLSRKALLVADTQVQAVPGFEEIFMHCEQMARSCALLRLALPQSAQRGLLALGARHAGRFLPSQGTELLTFLAQTLSLQVDYFLQDAQGGTHAP